MDREIEKIIVNLTAIAHHINSRYNYSNLPPIAMGWCEKAIQKFYELSQLSQLATEEELKKIACEYCVRIYDEKCRKSDMRCNQVKWLVSALLGKIPSQKLATEITPEQLHLWYLEAITHLDGADFDLEMDTPYEDLTEGQKSIGIYIANKINATGQTKQEIQKGAVGEFIATYLIPEYEKTYVDAKLRSNFMLIVDKAEVNMHEDMKLTQRINNHDTERSI